MVVYQGKREVIRMEEMRSSEVVQEVVQELSQGVQVVQGVDGAKKQQKVQELGQTPALLKPGQEIEKFSMFEQEGVS